MTQDKQIIKKPKKNGLQSSFQVHYQEGHQHSGLSGACQFADNPAEPEAAFSLLKFIPVNIQDQKYNMLAKA